MTLIREIEQRDNLQIANVIRTVFIEFGVNRPGTAFFDVCLDNLWEEFNQPDSFYNVCEIKGKIVGGAGIFPTPGLPGKTCELVKMYLLSDYRGMGIGNALLKASETGARKLGFTQIYLETMPELSSAIGMYKKSGYHTIPTQLGCSGHHGCSMFMMKSID